MAINRGKEYRIISHAGNGYMLRLTSNTPSENMNVRLGVESPTNKNQQWIVKILLGQRVLVTATDENFVLTCTDSNQSKIVTNPTDTNKYHIYLDYT